MTERSTVALAAVLAFLLGAAGATGYAKRADERIPDRMEVGRGPTNALFISRARRIGIIRGFASIPQCDAWAVVARGRVPSLIAVVCLPEMPPPGPDEGNSILPTLEEAGLAAGPKPR